MPRFASLVADLQAITGEIAALALRFDDGEPCGADERDHLRQCLTALEAEATRVRRLVDELPDTNPRH